uniref:Protein MCM10 homolog n=1 Tax=Cyclopterus lumpus TaxID=8103 RepID=A0A8C2ZM86_CYCLU
MDSEDDLDMLTALLAESEGVHGEQGRQEQADDLDGLFDADGDEEDEYKEGVEEEGPVVRTEDAVSDLFGEVDDIEKEDLVAGQHVCSTVFKCPPSSDELRRMQEQMQRLQQQLEASQKVSPSSSAPVLTARSSADPKPMTPKPKPARPPTSKLTPAKPASTTQRAKTQIGSTFQPVESTSKVSNPPRSSPASQSRPAASTGTPKPSLPPLPKDVGVEKYSGLRLRKPRVSSCEMDRKMADRRRIRLSEVPERLAQEKLEDCDWVTFAVLVNKVTPQSNSSGKTFSIWKLNDLHNLDVFVSLLLFGEVHKEHWKTEPGTVIGLLNPNPMKQKEGYDGVSLTVDNPQKVLLMGDAQDYSTCKAMKKNGDPCSQIVNMFECEYCQYHVKAQYKQMSSKRAELQSAYSGKAPNEVKVKGKGGSLRERLCQDGFYYGGVSSPACAAQNTSRLSVDPIVSVFFLSLSYLLAMQSGEVAGCSNEFKSLLSAPTPGALQLKKHLAQASKDAAAAPGQSVSASDLLKQQKQSQREFLQNRRRRAGEIQKIRLPSSAGPSPGASSSSLDRGGLMSPKSASEVPEATQSPAAPHGPTLGRGFTEGEDILFFENSPPPAAPAPSALSLSAAKLAAMKKLKAKGTGLNKEDPNAVKRKRSNDSEISARVEKNLTSPNEEPFQKKRREKLLYIQSEGFQKILNAKSRHDAALQAAEYQLQERYFDPLVKKEQMEEKMKGIREMKCRAVSCKKCSYTYFKPADRCVEENHNLRWHDATKRFFKCPCGQRAIALDRLPNKHCSNCGLFKWERDGMLKEKRGPKIAGELLQPRGEEHGKFLNSMK